MGRGGSDLSATVIGAALNLAEVQVWKDVDGKQPDIRMPTVVSEVCCTPTALALTHRSSVYCMINAEACWTGATAAAQLQHTAHNQACCMQHRKRLGRVSDDFNALYLVSC